MISTMKMEMQYNQCCDNMLKDERIPELVLPECDCSFNASGLLFTKFERCPCGSSLVRVTLEPIIKDNKDVGTDYNIICAKCGTPISGITDNFGFGISLEENNNEPESIQK